MAPRHIGCTKKSTRTCTLMLFPPVAPKGTTFAVSRPEETTPPVDGAPPSGRPHRDSPPLPRLSSMLQHQRNAQEAFVQPVGSSGPPRRFLRVPEWHQSQLTHMNGTSRSRTKPMSKVEETGTTVPVKASRYLREMDRQIILSRIEQGEKQSVLAKEYQVSRAAICNLNKHREEVLSRKDGNPMAKHPKKPRVKTGQVKRGKRDWTRADDRTRRELVGVYAMQSRAVVGLLTTLRNKHATRSEFRRSSDRLLRLLLEEALAFVPIKTVEIFLPNSSKSDGVALEHPPCAISMELTGYPLLELFRLIEPDHPTGYVTFRTLSGSDGQAVTATICGTRLPTSLNYHNVFILEHGITSADMVLAVVKRLQVHGAVIPMMSLVALFATADVVDQILGTFPALKIVVAQVEDGRSPTSAMILDRLQQVYHRLEGTR